MIAPPGIPNMRSIPFRISASHMICAPVRSRGSDNGPSVCQEVRLHPRRAFTARRAKHRSGCGVSDHSAVAGEPAARELGRPRRELRAARAQLAVTQLYVQAAAWQIDVDNVTVAQQRDRAAFRGFGGDMTDTQSARSSGEAAI